MSFQPRPVSHAHDDQPDRVWYGTGAAAVCARYVSFPFALLFPSIDNGIESVRIATDLSPDAVLTALFEHYARFPGRICRRSICMWISRNSCARLIFLSKSDVDLFFQALSELRHLCYRLQNHICDLQLKLKIMFIVKSNIFFLTKKVKHTRSDNHVYY